jgi:hypothetical protein
MGSVLMDNETLARSVKEVIIQQGRDSNPDEGDHFVQTQISSKRSPLVDELVMRMPSAAVSR